MSQQKRIREQEGLLRQGRVLDCGEMALPLEKISKMSGDRRVMLQKASSSNSLLGINRKRDEKLIQK